MKAFFFVGWFLGAVVSMLCVTAIFGPKLTYYYEHQQLLQECEKDLPINQTCRLYAKPKVKEE